MIVSPTEVATRMGRVPKGLEADQIRAWIGDVESLIRARIPTLETLALSDAYMTELTAVVCAVVIRKVDNPTGKMQERIDDYSYGLSVDQVKASDLTLTDAEWLRLIPSAAGGAFTIRPTWQPDTRGWP